MNTAGPYGPSGGERVKQADVNSRSSKSLHKFKEVGVKLCDLFLLINCLKEKLATNFEKSGSFSKSHCLSYFNLCQIVASSNH